MSTKPTDLPLWATDELYPAGLEIWSETDTKVEPTSGKQEEGWEPGERPAAQYMNWWMNNVYLWAEWLDDGDVEFVTVTTTDLNVTDDLDVDGDLNVDGNVTVAGDLQAGLLWHEFEESTILNGADWIDVNSAHAFLTNGGTQVPVGFTLQDNSNKLAMKLPVKANDVITGYTVYLYRGQNVGAVTGRIYSVDRQDPLGVPTALGAGSSSAAGWGLGAGASLTESGLSIAVSTADFEYYLMLTPSGSDSPGNDIALGGYFTWTHPL